MSEEILSRIEIIQCDIAELRDKYGNEIKVDAIVNAAKQTLMGGSGVDGAIHRAVDKLNGSEDLLKKEIKKQVDKDIINAKENRIRCNVSEVVVTKGYRLCDYIFHTVGPRWDGGSKSCLNNLKRCYENIIDKMLELNCETIAIPVISSGSYGFAFDLASKIEIVSICNCLIQKKKHNSGYNQIKKIYFVVYTENDINQFKKIYESYERNIREEKKSYYQTLAESDKSYVMEIEKYDSCHRGYFGLVKILRLLLIRVQSLFFITYFLKGHVFNRNWEERRAFIEWQVFIKVFIPIVGLLISAKLPLSRNLMYVISILIGISMIETIIYILYLIFLADIQNPSANIYRSIILLFENYVEINFAFAFLYNAFGSIENSTITKCVSYAFTNSNVEIANNWGYILSTLQSCISFIFGGLVLAYFVSNFKQRKFY